MFLRHREWPPACAPVGGESRTASIDLCVGFLYTSMLRLLSSSMYISLCVFVLLEIWGKWKLGKEMLVIPLPVSALTGDWGLNPSSESRFCLVDNITRYMTHLSVVITAAPPHRPPESLSLMISIEAGYSKKTNGLKSFLLQLSSILNT